MITVLYTLFDQPGQPTIVKKVPKGYRLKRSGEVFEEGDLEGYALMEDTEPLKDWASRTIDNIKTWAAIGHKVPDLCILTPLGDDTDFYIRLTDYEMDGMKERFEPETPQEAPQSNKTESEGDAMARFFKSSAGTWEGF